LGKENKRLAHKLDIANDEPVNRSRQHAVQPLALSAQKRSTVIDTLHSEDYCDQPLAEVYQRLLEQKCYLCSISTMHRLLKTLQETGERRHQRPAQKHAIPRLLAPAPNEVWSWGHHKTTAHIACEYYCTFQLTTLKFIQNGAN
jgi:putative transposase